MNELEDREAIMRGRLTVARQVASLLGGTVDDYKPKGEPRSWYDTRYDISLPSPLFEGDTECGINFAFVDNGRVSITGDWPSYRAERGSKTYVFPRDVKYGTAQPAITVSASKSVEQIAADIGRRFMPEYLEQYVQCYEAARRHEDYHTRLHAFVCELAVMFDGKVSNNGSGDSVHAAGVYFKSISGDGSARVEVDLDRDGLAALAKLLKAQRPKP